MDWIALTQDKDRWWAHGNAVMNLLGSKTYGEFDQLRTC